MENIDEYKLTRERLEAGESLELTPEGELAPQVHPRDGDRRVRGSSYGNVRNDGLIDNLPAGACVEVPCRVDADGVHPLAIGALPAQCAALNRTFLNVVELTVRAALEESPELVHQAVLLDPNAAATLTTAQSEALVDELIEAHGELMPAGIRAGRRRVAAA